ncbi:MAG: hypothetical protein ACFFD1_04660 [Candidatus Thorarchaeota archaeon]
MIKSTKKYWIILFFLTSLFFYHSLFIRSTNINERTPRLANDIKNGHLGSFSSNTTYCRDIGPQNSVYITVLGKNLLPLAGVNMNGSFTTRCGNKSTTFSIQSEETPSNGALLVNPIGCDCGWGLYNITLTKNDSSYTFTFTPPVKVSFNTSLSQVTWVKINFDSQQVISMNEYAPSNCTYGEEFSCTGSMKNGLPGFNINIGLLALIFTSILIPALKKHRK